MSKETDIAKNTQALVLGFFAAALSLVGVAMILLISNTTTISCDRGSAECSIKWEYLFLPSSTEEWLMAENAGMHIDVSVDDEGEDTYRPIIRLHTGRNIPVQEYTSTSVRWQEELTRDFNGFLDSPDTPSFAYTSDNYIGLVVGSILQFVAFLLWLFRRM